MSYEGYDYPSDEQLKRVQRWSEFFPTSPNRADYSQWFAFIKTLWWMPDWGWKEYDGLDGDDKIRVFHISTGGWSGNESILSAMEKNFIGWSQTFNAHRTGGHYEFWIPRPPRNSTGNKRGKRKTGKPIVTTRVKASSSF